MTPLPCAVMVSATAWAQWKTPRRFTSITRSNCSSVIFCRRASCVMPALFTRMSMRPKRSFTWATTASTMSRWVTSITKPTAGGAQRFALLHRIVHRCLLHVADDDDGALLRQT